MKRIFRVVIYLLNRHLIQHLIMQSLQLYVFPILKQGQQKSLYQLNIPHYQAEKLYQVAISIKMLALCITENDLIWILSITSLFLTSGWIVSISQIGKQGSSKAMAEVEMHTAPVTTKIRGLANNCLYPVVLLVSSSESFLWIPWICIITLYWRPS